MIKLLSYLLSLLCITSVFAKTNGDSLEPLSWQVVKLENMVRGKLEAKLDSVIKDKTYTIDINIETTLPKKPNFKQTPPQPPESVKYTNARKPSNSSDYIVFSKFGLEAPVAANMAVKTPPKKSEFEYLWKYQESQNVYNNLLKILVKIRLNNKIPEQKRSELEEFVTSTDFNLNKLRPEIEFTYTDFSPLSVKAIKERKNKAKMEAKKKEDKFDKLLERLATPVSLLLATLILVCGAFLLFKKYEKLKKNQVSQKLSHEGRIENNQENDSNNGDEAAALGQPAPNTLDAELDGVSGLERFKVLYADSFEISMILIKNWIKSDQKSAHEALVYLLDQLNSEDLHIIFSGLSLAERQTWKGYINTIKLSINAHDKIDRFIAKEIITNFIVPDVVTDIELRKQLLNLNEKKATKFIKENPEFASTLINISPASVLLNILSGLESTKKAQYLQEAAKFSATEIASQMTKLKSALLPYVQEERISQFVEKLMELIPVCAHTEEETIYTTLLENNLYDKAENMAINYFPSFLAFELSPTSLKTVLNKFSMSEKAYIIESFDDETDKEILTNAFAPDGSTAREMFELETEQFGIDLNAKRKLDESKEKNVALFYARVREVVQKNGSVNIDAKNVVASWVESNMSTNSHESQYAA